MKYFIAFLAGAAAGAIGSYLYFRNKVDEAVKDEVTAEMEKFFERQEQMISAPEETEEEKKDEPVVTDIPDTTEKTSIIKMEEIIHTNYRDVEEEEDDEDYISDEEVEELLEASRKRMEEGPHLIDSENDTLVGYDLVEYTWYPDGDILTDAFDNVIDDPSWLFAPVEWKKELADKESITIRVPEEATDFTIWNDAKLTK